MRLHRLSVAPRRRGRFLGVLAQIALVFMVCMTALMIHPSAHATDSSVEVTLTTSEVTGQGEDAAVHLAGTVTNTGSTTLYTVQVLTWRNTTPITSRAQLAEELAASPTATTGSRVTMPGSFQAITGSPKPWAPGASSTFSVTTKLSDLDLSETGVYLVGVHVRASTDGSASYQTYGRARTLITVGTPTATAATSSVVLLNSTPSYLGTGVLSDDHLADELTGRLLTLVRYAQQRGVTYAIDPLLYREVTTMAQGYRVGTGSSQTAGTGSQAAIAWLAEFANLSGGYRLPYGSPDLALLAETGDTMTLDQTTSALTQVPGLAQLPLLVAAPNYQADQRFLTAVARLKPSVVLAETKAGGQTVTASDLKIISVDPGAFSGGPGPDDTSTELQKLARLRAESFLAATNTAEGNIRIVTDESEVTLDSMPNPWESRVSLADLSSATNSWSDSLAMSAPVSIRGAALEQLLPDAVTRISKFACLIDNSASGETITASLLPPLMSTEWQNDDQARAYLDQALKQYEIGESALALSVAPHIVMTSRDTQFPVTVTNHLDYPVTVKVKVTTANRNRLNVEDSEFKTVDSGESVTVNVSPKATANGSVDSVVHLVTKTGDEVATPQPFVIEATETGKVAWVIVIVSGVVLAAMTVLRIRQVARAPRRKESV